MAAGAGFKQTASAWDSGIKDHASRLLTGKESSSHNASSLHVGVGNVEQMKAAGYSVSAGKADSTGKATLGNVQEAYADQAKQKVQKIEAEKEKNKNPPPEPEKVNINGNEQKGELE